MEVIISEGMSIADGVEVVKSEVEDAILLSFFVFLR